MEPAIFHESRWFCRSGKYLIQKDLSDVLKSISSMDQMFFIKAGLQKEWLKIIVKTVESYQCRPLPAILLKLRISSKGNYKGYEAFFALWMPAFGAITIEALHILEDFNNDLSDKNQWAESIYQAVDAAYLDRKGAIYP